MVLISFYLNRELKETFEHNVVAGQGRLSEPVLTPSSWGAGC